MQARLEIRRFPSALAGVIFALVAALVLGGALGYVLKPTTIITRPPRVVVLPVDPGSSNPNDYGCQFVNQHKAC